MREGEWRGGKGREGRRGEGRGREGRGGEVREGRRGEGRREEGREGEGRGGRPSPKPMYSDDRRRLPRAQCTLSCLEISNSLPVHFPLSVSLLEMAA